MTPIDPITTISALFNLLKAWVKERKRVAGDKTKDKLIPDLKEAIRELLKENPNHMMAKACIAKAKAAGIISNDLFLAEEMLSKYIESIKPRLGKKVAAKKTTAKKPCAKKAPLKRIIVAKKKTASKPVAKKAAIKKSADLKSKKK